MNVSAIATTSVISDVQIMIVEILRTEAKMTSPNPEDS
jgi:hypothetical protein